MTEAKNNKNAVKSNENKTKLKNGEVQKNILFIRNIESFRHRYIFLQCDVEIDEQATVFFVGQVL